MTQVLNLSDYHLILSDEHSKFVIHGPAQTSPPARCGLPPIEQILRGSLIETYKRCGRPNCHCVDGTGHGPKRYLSTISRTGERPRVGYVPNAAHAEVREFLTNFRKLREVLNEICAIMPNFCAAARVSTRWTRPSLPSTSPRRAPSSPT
jgi:hypothetical protein